KRFAATALVRKRHEAFSLEAYTRCRDHDIDRECRAGHVLAVSAMADCTAEGFSAALISNCATKTSTRDFCHSYSPRFVFSNKRRRSRPKGKQCPHSYDAALYTTPASEALAHVGRGYVSVPRQSYRSDSSDISVQIITV